MSERFYINLPLAPGVVDLHGPEAHHLSTVCRLGPGDQVCLFNGDGHEYPARILVATRKAVQLEILGVAAPQREIPFALEVAAPLPKADRGQFLIEKLTELGVTSFVPLSCARSVVHPREGKLDKLHRYVIEASKQCGRNHLMRVGAVEEWRNYGRSVDAGEVCFLAHPGGTENLGEVRTTPARIVIAVGPEGGFTDTEVAQARTHGWRLVGLGPRILRVETAAIALAAQIIAFRADRRSDSRAL